MQVPQEDMLKRTFGLDVGGTEISVPHTLCSDTEIPEKQEAGTP